MPNPVLYAEQELGVHDVWNQAQQRLAQHAAAVAEKASLTTSIRRLKVRMADREAELTSDLIGLHADLKTATERTKAVKDGIQKDSQMRDLRAELDDLESTRDMITADISSHEQGCHVMAARMVELGGLLQFYAAARTK